MTPKDEKPMKRAVAACRLNHNIGKIKAVRIKHERPRDMAGFSPAVEADRTPWRSDCRKAIVRHKPEKKSGEILAKPTVLWFALPAAK
jgi:hypothetical protein